MARNSDMNGEAFPREFRLAAACCRWPLSEAALGEIRALAAGATDWPYFLRIVTRQRLAGLAHHALASAGIDVPGAVARELAGRARGIAGHNQAMAEEAIRLQGAFDAAGIPVLALKGVSLAQLAYGTPLLKHGRDIDLLVPPERAVAAFALLEEAGYALRDPARQMSTAQRLAFVAHGREAEFYCLDDAKQRLELHWRLADNPLLLRGVEASSPAQSVPMPGGGALRTLAEDDLFAYLCVHGAIHAWSRLKWLADLNALLAAKLDDEHDDEIVRLYRHAQARGAGLCAGQALVLCQRLLGLPLPVALDNELAANGRVQRLTAIALRAMIGADAETEPARGLAAQMHSALMPFLLGQGFAYFAAQCRIVCVGHADVIRFPLPPFLYFLYPVMRFPSWIWRRLWAPRGAPSP